MPRKKQSEKKIIAEQKPAEAEIKVSDFLKSGKKILLITGEEGSGKSFLLDKFFKEVNSTDTNERVFRYDIDNLRKLSNPLDFLEFFADSLDSAYELKGFDRGNTIFEKTQRIQDRFNAINSFHNPDRILLVIDGAEKYSEITKFIPCPCDWFRFIISSRKNEFLKFWTCKWSENDFLEIDLGKGDCSKILEKTDPETKIFIKNSISKAEEISPSDLIIACAAFEMSGDSQESFDAESYCMKICEHLRLKEAETAEAKAVLSLSACGFPVRGKDLSALTGSAVNTALKKPKGLGRLIKTGLDKKGDLLLEIANGKFSEYVRREFFCQIENIESKIVAFLSEEAKPPDLDYREFCLKFRACSISNDFTTGKGFDPETLKAFVWDMYYETSDLAIPLGLISKAVEYNLGKNPRNELCESELVSLLLYSEELFNSKNTEKENESSVFTQFLKEGVSEVQTAISKMSKLDDLTYYSYTILLTLSLVLARGKGKENTDVTLGSLFEDVFIRLSEGTGDWRFYFSDKFMAYWASYILPVHSSDDVWKFLTIGAIDKNEKDRIALRVIDEMISSKDAEGALALTKKMNDSEEKAQKYSEIALILANSENPSKALRILMSTGDIKSRASILSLVSKKIASVGQIDEAMSIAESIDNKDEKYSAMSFAAVSYAEKMKGSREDNSDLNKALRISEKIDDVYLKNKTIADIAIKVSSARLEEGLSILERIGSDDHEMRSFALSEISKELSEKSMNDKAQDVANGMPDNIYKSSALAFIAKKLYQKGSKEKAYEIADKIPFFSYKFQTLFQMSKDSSKTEDKYLTIPPPPEDDEAAKREAGEKFKEALIEGDVKTALDILDSLIEQIEKIGLLLKTVSSGEELGDSRKRAVFYDSAIEALKKMNLDPSAHMRVMSLIAHGMAKTGDVEKALVRMAGDLVKKSFSEETFATAELLTDISDHLIKTMNQTMTYQYIEKPDEFNDKARLLRSLVKMFIENSDVGSAIAISESISEPYEKSRMRTEIALHFILTGEKDKALNIVRKIENDIERDESLSKLSEKTALLAGPEEAQGILNEISQDWLRKETISQIVMKFAERKDYQTALFYAGKTGDTACVSVLYAKIACSAYKEKSRGEFENIFSSAVNMTRQISCEKHKSRALSEIAACLLKVDLVDKAIEVSELITDPFEKFQAVLFLEDWMFENGYRKKALELSDHVYGILKLIENQDERSEAYAEFVRNLIKNRDADKAEAIAEEITDSDRKARLLALTVLEKFKERGSNDCSRLLSKIFDAADKIQNRKDRSKSLEDIFVMCLSENEMEKIGKFLRTSFLHPELSSDSASALYNALIQTSYQDRKRIIESLRIFFPVFSGTAVRLALISLVKAGEMSAVSEILKTVPELSRCRTENY